MMLDFQIGIQYFLDASSYRCVCFFLFCLGLTADNKYEGLVLNHVSPTWFGGMPQSQTEHPKT